MNDLHSDLDRPKAGGARIGIAISVLTVLLAAGLAFFGVGALTAPSSLVPAGASVDIYAQFLASRNLPLALSLLIAVFIRDRRVLATLLAVGGLMQIGDLIIGIAHQSLAIVVAPFVLAVLYLAAAGYLFTRSRPLSAS